MFWAAAGNGIYAALVFIWLGSHPIVFINGFLGVVAFVFMYVLQDPPTEPVKDEYSVVIRQITEIGKTLSSLSAFLEKERQRVSNTEGVIKKLEEEKTKLEPIVISQRETVEAILSAHSRRTASHAWKERIIGFFLGALASMLASFIYSYVK
jgi:septal ring factor EnvC (AmiA/AmiB activator)